MNKTIKIKASEVQAGDVLHQGCHRHVVDEVTHGASDRLRLSLNNDTGTLTLDPSEKVVVSRAAHVADPWVAVQPSDPDNFDRKHIEIHDPYGRTATVYGEVDDPEVQATAKLIANAPKLLKLVQSMQACIRSEAQPYSWGPYEQGEVIEIVDTVRMREVHAQAVALLKELGAQS
nr:hypothetical protein WG33_0135 [uncultured bacterium]